jgi:uncharacterized protein with FMN-binding domain
MIKKFFLSSFVVFTFIAYVAHQRFTNPDSALSPTPTISSIVSQQNFNTPVNNVAPTVNAPLAANIPTAVPIPPTATSASNQGVYKDGVYTGPQVDAYYGIVEVQATVQNGQITNVQFVKYPNDRRTSVRINNIAMPYLQQEALQAQSAHINIISGATFTSEGFAMSLNAALNSAKN